MSDFQCSYIISSETTKNPLASLYRQELSPTDKHPGDIQIPECVLQSWPAIDVLRNQIRPSVVGLNEKSWKPVAALWRMGDLVLQTNLMIWLQGPGMQKKKKTPLSKWK